MQTQNNKPSVIACNVSAIDPSHRNNHVEVAEHIFTSVLETTELAEGYAFRLPLETSMLENVMTWISNERLCCPFFSFTLEIGGQFWLKLSGGDKVKDFVRSTIVDTLRETDKLPDKETGIATHSQALSDD